MTNNALCITAWKTAVQLSQEERGQEREGDRMRAGGVERGVIKIYGEIKVDRDEGHI